MPAAWDQWRNAFLEQVQRPTMTLPLKEAALAEDLGSWTSSLTTVVVRACESLGWEAAAKWKLSPTTARSLREPVLKIAVTAVKDDPDAKRISLELRWKNREGDYVAPVRLTRFLYRRRPSP